MSNSQSLAALQQSGKAPAAPVSMSFFDLQGFELMQRIAKAFSSSNLVPQAYQNNLPNSMIALDMARRIGANPLMVMQNLYVVHGTPSWSSKFLIATVNTCGRYSTLRYEWVGTKGKDDYGCRAWAIEKDTGERLEGIVVDWAMVKAEGWNSKKGSKWMTMADQMFIYRAAAFWQRAYAPDLGMGLVTEEEVRDTYDAQRDATGNFTVELQELQQQAIQQQSDGTLVNTDTGEVLEPEPEQAASNPEEKAEMAADSPEPEDNSPAPAEEDTFE